MNISKGQDQEGKTADSASFKEITNCLKKDKSLWLLTYTHVLKAPA